MIRGRVGSGRGIAGARLAKIQELSAVLGYVPFPGTLNVRLVSSPDLRGRLQGGPHAFYPVEVSSRVRKVPAHIVRWQGDERDRSVEIVAEVELRRDLQLTNGETVMIHFPTEERV